MYMMFTVTYRFTTYQDAHRVRLVDGLEQIFYEYHPLNRDALVSQSTNKNKHPVPPFGGRAILQHARDTRGLWLEQYIVQYRPQYTVFCSNHSPLACSSASRHAVRVYIWLSCEHRIVPSASITGCHSTCGFAKSLFFIC